MQFYFFRTIDETYAPAFQKIAFKQNVLITKLLCWITAVLCVATRISSLFLDYDRFLPSVKSLRESIDFRLITAVLYLALFQFGKVFFKGNKSKLYSLYNFLSDSYPFLIITGSIFTTFMLQSSSASTLTMFLFGMLVVGVFWILDLKKTVFYSVYAAVLFFAGLHYFQADPGKLMLNYIFAIFILVAFFCIARVCFSYHYNYFVQIKIIEQKNKEINKINNMQTELLSIVAHDLRSPINNISALVDLTKNYPASEAEKNEYYEMILQACGEADHIIHDLVDVAKNSENTALQTTGVNLNEFLAATQAQWLHRIGEGRQLVFNEPNINFSTQIHPQKMQRVLDNLINNAMKFTNEQGIITIGLQNNDSEICISVSDNGIGIPTSLQPHLFDRFSSAGRIGLNNEKSYGLGLSICKQIIEQHGGSIRVKSEDGHGTTFIIALPMEIDGAGTLQKSSRTAQLA